MRPRAIVTIARKDLVDAIRNLYILGAIVLPLGFWLLFRFVFPVENAFNIGTVAVFDENNSQLVERLRTQPAVTKLIETRSFEELTQTVRSEAVGGLALPAGFDAALQAGQTPELRVLTNGQRGGTALAAFRQLVSKQLEDLSGRAPVAKLVEADVNAPQDTVQPKGFSVQDYILGLLLILSMAMTGAFVVPTLLVEEKEKHTLKTILMSPASYADVVAGKASVGLIFTLVNVGLLIALNDGLRGNLILLALAMILGSLVTVEVGLLMGALFNTANQLNTWSSLIILVLVLPSWVSNLVSSGPLAGAMGLLPTYYVMKMFDEARRGLGSADVWPSAAVLIGCIVVLFAAIVWSLRRAER